MKTRFLKEIGFLFFIILSETAFRNTKDLDYILAIKKLPNPVYTLSKSSSEWMIIIHLTVDYHPYIP